MKITGSFVSIYGDFLNHLFVNIPCPVCGVAGLVSLDMIRTQRLRCSKCRNEMRFDLYFDELKSFARAFENLHERLQRVDLGLMFSPEPKATIEKKGDTP